MATSIQMVIMKPVPGMDDYWTDTEGHAYSSRRLDFRRLKPRLSSRGYLLITMYIGGKPKGMLVHRMVALAHIPNPEGKPYVDHINRIKTDNRVSNLRWVTSSENGINKIVKGGVSFNTKDRRWVATYPRYISEIKQIKRFSRNFKTKEEADAQLLEWQTLYPRTTEL